jgi:hypothetical protein
MRRIDQGKGRRSKHCDLVNKQQINLPSQFVPNRECRQRSPSHYKMSATLKSKKKPELQALAAQLGVDTDGSKNDLEARILLHLADNADLRDDPKFSRYYAAITGPHSPGPVAAVASGSHKRRSVAAKKSTDMGESSSKALITT